MTPIQVYAYLTSHLNTPHPFCTVLPCLQPIPRICELLTCCAYKLHASEEALGHRTLKTFALINSFNPHSNPGLGFSTFVN